MDDFIACCLKFERVIESMDDIIWMVFFDDFIACCLKFVFQRSFLIMTNNKEDQNKKN